jgi:hypothetical protein
VFEPIATFDISCAAFHVYNDLVDFRRSLLRFRRNALRCRRNADHRGLILKTL